MVSATVTLYKDIGLDPFYKKTIDFTSKLAQTTWFNTISSNLRTTFTDVNYNKLQNSFAIHEPIGDVYEYTYVRIQDMDSSNRTYYGFIGSVELVDEETTRFNINIDPIQTFMCEYEIMESMVIREHVDRFNSSGNVIWNKPSTISLEQQSVTLNEVMITRDRNDESVPIDFQFVFVLYTETIEQPNNTSYVRCVTFPVTQNGVISADISPSTGTAPYYYFTLGNIRNGSMLAIMGINPEAVIAICISPMPIRPYWFKDNGSGSYELEFLDTVGNANANEYLIYEESGQSRICYDCSDYIITGGDSVGDYSVKNCQMYINCRQSLPTAPSDGSTYNPDSEVVMFQSPYMERYVVNGAGTLNLKIPDYALFGENALTSLNVWCELLISGSRQCIMVSIGEIYGQNGTAGTNQNNVENIIELVNANRVMFFDLPTLDVLSSEWQSYLLTRRDSDLQLLKNQAIQNTINNALFMGYGGALVGSRSNSGVNDPLKGNQGNIPGYGSALIKATGLGVATSVVGSVVDAYFSFEQQKLEEQSMKKEPSQLLINGTYGGINYTVGGNTFAIVTTKCNEQVYNSNLSTFHYYGYEINRIEKPNLRTRKYYNYILTQGAIIGGSISQDIKQALARIFDAGITIFHGDYCDEPYYPTNSSGVEYENIERSLMS